MKKIILVIAVAQYLGCAADHEYSRNPSAAESLSCQIAGRERTMPDEITNSTENILSKDVSNFDHFIIKYKSKSETAGLLSPSGNPVREYVVKGITFKNITHGTYSFSIETSAEEKQKILSDLASQQDVEYIEPDYPIYANQESPAKSDLETSQFSDQWALPKVNLSAAWNITKGSKEIVIAVLDSGIDYTHKDLKNNIWRNPKEVINGIDDDANGFIDDVYGWNFVSNNADPKTLSTSNHGSHVAGIIGGNRGDGQGILGIAPNVKMMALKFIGENGSGSTSAAIRGIDYAISKKVFAINNSWGSGGGSKSLADAIGRAEKAGILFIVAAGNGSGGAGFSIDTQGWYPASYRFSNVLNVAATGSTDTLTSFSNFGLNNVDVAAPGLNILSTVSNQGYQKMSGTSMAAPLVTGLAVLVKAANPTLNYAQVINVIRSSVDRTPSLSEQIASGGRVNALRAVQVAVANIGKKIGGGGIVSPCP